MHTLTYDGEQTVDVQRAQEIIEELAEIHQGNNITISSVSMRMRDESMLISVSMEARGEIGEVESMQGSLRETADDLGFENQADGVTLA